MAARRKYDDGCAAAHALDLIGDRWALLVVRELLLGPKRFTDVLAGLPGAGPDMVTQRLRELTGAGVVRRRRLPPPTPVWVYEVTAWGAELEPVILALGRWGARSPGMCRDGAPGIDALMLSLKVLFDPAQDFTATVAVLVEGHCFEVRVDGDDLSVRRAEPEQPDVIIEGDLPTMYALLRTDRPLGQVFSAPLPSRDREQIERFRGLFRWPSEVPAEDRR